MEDKIRRFADQMQIEIDNNRHKTGSIWNWRGMYEKVADLEYHKGKMLIAMKYGNKLALKEYLADCANILMSIGDECGLYEEESVNDGDMTIMSNAELFSRMPVDDKHIAKPFFDKFVTNDNSNVDHVRTNHPAECSFHSGEQSSKQPELFVQCPSIRFK